MIAEMGVPSQAEQLVKRLSGEYQQREGVCVCERERESDRARDSEREREREGERERGRLAGEFQQCEGMIYFPFCTVVHVVLDKSSMNKMRRWTKRSRLGEFQQREGYVHLLMFQLFFFFCIALEPRVE